MKIKIYDIGSDATIDVDKGLRLTHGSLESFTCSWSPDSRWLTFSRDLENYHNAVFIYDFQNKKIQQITDGYCDCVNPVFEADGKYIYLLTSQSFKPSYSDIDNSFIYPNSTQIAAISLKKTTRSLLYPRNDTVEVTQDETISKTESKKKNEKDSNTAEEKKAKVNPVEIDFDGLESRMVILPIDPGNYANLSSAKANYLSEISQYGFIRF